jgi:hypothetical protein
MTKLFEFMMGFFFGALAGFLLVEGLFGEDPVQREITERSKKAYCEAYKEELMVSQSPEDKMHQVELYSSLCQKSSEAVLKIQPY